MENAKLQQLRKEVRMARNDTQKRRKLCGDFTSEMDEFDPTGEREGYCARCGKPFKNGDRRFHFQGWDQEYCDHCFCDAMEVEIYRGYGFSFEDEDGGGTLWVEIQGEDGVLCSRW